MERGRELLENKLRNVEELLKELYDKHKDIKIQRYRAEDEETKATLDKQLAVEIDPEIKYLEKEYEELVLTAINSLDHKVEEKLLEEVELITTYLDSNKKLPESKDFIKQLEYIVSLRQHSST